MWLGADLGHSRRYSTEALILQVPEASIIPIEIEQVASYPGNRWLTDGSLVKQPPERHLCRGPSPLTTCLISRA